MTQPPSQTERLQMAEEFLQEAVYRSRGAQAGKALLAPPKAGVKGQCGLGQEAAIVLDLSPRGEALFERLWAVEPEADEVARIHAKMADWIEEQDQLDRKRNHFLKAFRGKHGARRADYDPETLVAFEAGLGRGQRGSRPSTPNGSDPLNRRIARGLRYPFEGQRRGKS